MRTKKMILVLFILFFTACSLHKIEKEESAFIIIKTAKFKYADMGFISSNSSVVKVEIYGAGQPLMNLEINGINVCMSTFKCMEKKDFNAEVLHASYPETLLENIFKSKPIFDKKSLVKEKEGFSQKLTKEGVYDISYSVKGSQRIFRDSLNKILIKVREE
jgi:hypothetical protein